MRGSKINIPRAPIVGTFSMSFKKSTKLIEDVAEAKKNHREKLKTLIDTYVGSVEQGDLNVEGIRNAKDLVDIIKLDLLLLGEPTERHDNGLEEMRIAKMTKALKDDDPALQAVMQSIMQAFNEANDEMDDSVGSSDAQDVSTNDVEIEVVDDGREDL